MRSSDPPKNSALSNVASGLALTAAVIGAIRLLTHDAISLPLSPNAQPVAWWVGLATVVYGLLITWIVQSNRDRTSLRITVAVAFVFLFIALFSYLTYGTDSEIPLFHARRLASAAVILLSVALILSAFRRTLDFASIFGIGMVALGFATAMGRLYGGPLVTRGQDVPVNLLGSISTMLLGTAMILSVGDAHWPVRSFVGSTPRAILLRWFVPLTAVLIIVTDFTSIRFFSQYSNAVGSALNTMLSVGVTVAAVSLVGAIIGNRLETAAAARRESEEKYTELIEGVRDVIFTLSPDGRVTSMNPAWEQLTGFTCDETLGKFFVELIHPDDAPRATQELMASLSGTPFAGRAPLRILTANGGSVFGDVNVVPRLENGKLVRMFGVGRDVTDRVSLEEELRQSQKMEAIGKLAGGVAHDFNNLLTVIIGSGELALQTMPKDDVARADIEEMVNAGTRASQLTKQLLAFSRRQVLEPKVLNLNDLVANAESMLRRMIDRRIDIRTDLARDLGMIKADPGQLDQILINLAVNARDAMPRGGVLTIKTRNVDGYVELCVADNGTGMSEDVKSHVFEPFFTTKPSGQGTGLGLSTVFGIVHQSGGVINVDSSPGEGTRFSILLPRVLA